MAGLYSRGTNAPVGTVAPFAGTVAPSGWLLCNTNTPVSRTTYAALFSIIGISHGNGDGSTTFNIPNYAGRFLRAVNASSGLDPDVGTRTAMNPGGNTTTGVGSVQPDAMQGHFHNFAIATNAGGPGNGGVIGGSTFTVQTNAAVTDGTNGTPRVAAESRAKNAYVNYIIKI